MRLFRCGACGHRMRFGSLECGKCGAATPIYKMSAPYVTFVVLAAASLPVVLLLRVLL